MHALLSTLLAAAAWIGTAAPAASSQIEVGKPFPFPDHGLPLAESGEVRTLATFQGEPLLLHLYASW